MDYASIGQEALARIAAACDLDTLERLRVEFLGKQGSISGLLKTLGAMSAEQRQLEGPQIHSLREGVTAALSARKDGLEAAALDAQLAAETSAPSPSARGRQPRQHFAGLVGVVF